MPPDQTALEDVVIHLSPCAQRDWGVTAWVQLVDALATFMRVHPHVQCTLCLDFSENFGRLPKPKEVSHIAAYVKTLTEVLPACQSPVGDDHGLRVCRVGLIWQTYFRAWERAGAAQAYPKHSYVGEAMGVPEWYYSLRDCTP